ncbi:alpha/beta hydrolase [Sinomonas notoginsengisoli]|uniref:alpha/beta fold hydrolase n=1 Tax=Sinomonas notoginsengisoli TaxID=1457311 RepID=UPI001F1E053F|nr:alpha/beta hydrolase [Sinomonas notoginsengisoli]
MVAPQLQSVRTPDGGVLSVYSYGTGPGAVLAAGSLTRTILYSTFASSLSATIPVHVYDRRGRGKSSPLPADYSMDAELDDLKAVLDATGSSVVLGHSYGGGIALEAALCLPVSRVAVYDPAVNIAGCLPTRMLPELIEAAAKGDYVRAVQAFSREIDPRVQKTVLPDQAVRLVLWAISRMTKDGRAWKEMVPALAQEIALLDSSHPASTRYAGIAVPVLLLAGADSPDYFHTIAASLAASLASSTSVIVPRSSHGALQHPSGMIVNLFRRFLRQEA